MNLEKAIIDRLKILPAGKPIRTPDLRREIHRKHKDLVFTKKGLNQMLYYMMEEEIITKCDPKVAKDAPRWKLKVKRFQMLLK